MGLLKISGRAYSLRKCIGISGLYVEIILTRRYRGTEYGRAELVRKDRCSLSLIKDTIRHMAHDIERMIHVEESKATKFPQAHSSRRCIY